MPKNPNFDDERFLAVVDLIRRTGAQSFQIRYQDDEIPTVWVAIAGYGEQWEAGGALNPLMAAWRLAEALIDGGMCTHCSKPTGVTNDWTGEMPLQGMICWYIYDPELKKFRRGCEGDT